MAGRGFPAPTFIVAANEFVNNDDMRSENYIFRDIYFSTNINCIKWLAKRRLLHNTMRCNRCLNLMSFLKLAQCIDGYHWRCKECGTAASIRQDSYFSRSHLTFEQLLVILYGWASDFPQKTIAREARIKEGSRHTIIDWCSLNREICKQDILNNPVAIGGLRDDYTAKIVEIDESKFFHRKCHRGMWREGHWVFGGIERETGRCFLVEFPDRTAATLTAVIERYILPGSIIISDGRRAYNTVAEIGGGIYEHQVNVHEEKFVDPNNRNIHTQNVENMWMRARRKLRRQFGTSEAQFTSYLHEFIWRNKHRNENIFTEFLICITEQYPV